MKRLHSIFFEVLCGHRPPLHLAECADAKASTTMLSFLHVFHYGMYGMFSYVFGCDYGVVFVRGPADAQARTTEGSDCPYYCSKLRGCVR